MGSGGVLAVEAVQVFGWIAGIVVFGLIGMLIGGRKGRPGLGFILGAIFGCLGWIVLLLLPEK